MGCCHEKLAKTTSAVVAKSENQATKQTLCSVACDDLAHPKDLLGARKFFLFVIDAPVHVAGVFLGKPSVSSVSISENQRAG